MSTQTLARRQDFVVERTARTWGVFCRGTLMEGGYFTRAGAEAAREAWAKAADQAHHHDGGDAGAFNAHGR